MSLRLEHQSLLRGEDLLHRQQHAFVLTPHAPQIPIFVIIGTIAQSQCRTASSSICVSKDQDLQLTCGFFRTANTRTGWRKSGTLPSNGGWSAGRTARPRWRPRPCSRRTAVSKVPSHHPRAEKADSVSHAFAKSWCCSLCSSGALVVFSPGLGSCMKGESREIRSARGLCFVFLCEAARLV